MADPVTTEPVSASDVDLFLSYNHLDRPSVDSLQKGLRQRGIATFLDHASLSPGLPWPVALEAAMKSARAVVVLLGPQGLGGWQRREIFFALDLQVAAEKQGRTFPVIPVLLDGADPTPSFLMLNTCVDLRADEEHAIDSLAEAVSGRTAPRPTPAPPADLRPYVGLHAFREEDGGFFFGRTAFVDRLFECLERHKTVAAVGASGSGKSSIVFAGLVPRLRRQRPPYATWEVCSFTPGVYVWRRLADALVPLLEPHASQVERIARSGELQAAITGNPAALASAVKGILSVAGGSDRLLLVVDQFEELFTLTMPDDRGSFVETLLDATEAAPLSIVLTMRADFYGRALERNRRLSESLGRATVPIGPLLRDELHQAIEGPAVKAGASFQPGLVDLILSDVLRRPGQLPLLQYSLTELWSRCTARAATGRREITLADYRDSGGLEGVIAQRAEKLFNELTEAEQRDARRLFGLLVNVARGGDEFADTRRRARESEVGPECWSIAQRFAGPDYRLVVISREPGSSEATVEVVHEAVVLHWERLRRWVEEDRVALVVEQQVTDARGLWDAHGRDEAYVLDGPALAAAQDWAEQNWQRIGSPAFEFLIRSLVRNGGPLGRWVPRYAERAEATALGRGYLESGEADERRRGLDVLRWAPEQDGSADAAVVDVAVMDPVPELRRYAVEVLCGRGNVDRLGARLRQEPGGKQQPALLRALGHARNVRGVGLRAVAGLPTGVRWRVSWFALGDLLWLHRATFALSFALTSLFFSVSWEVASRFVHMAFDMVSSSDTVNVLAAFYETAWVMTVSVVLIALLRSIIDERRATPGYIFKAGVVAGIIAQVIQIVGRIVQELARLGLGIVIGQPQSAVNLIFAVTDQVGTILAMGILAFAAVIVARAPARGRILRRLVPLAAATAITGDMIQFVLIPVVLDFLGRNFQWARMPNLVIGVTMGVLLSTIAGVAGLLGFRIALRIAFGDRHFPDWPVPGPA